MSSLADHLNGIGANMDTVQHAGRNYVTLRSGFLTAEKMSEELAAAVRDKGELDKAIASLGQDPAALEDAYLFCLSQAWDEPGQQTAVRQAIDGAQRKLPVVELSILALTAAYGMYLLSKGVPSKRSVRVIHRPDGTFESVEVTEYQSVSSALKGLFSVFGS